MRFPGQYRDAETGLFYNYFRDYDPQTGRYVQFDPVGIFPGHRVSTARSSLNHPYGYADQNPLAKSDRLGLNPLDQSGSKAQGPYVPGPFDVFIPGTPANKAFGKSLQQIGRAISDICFPSSADDDRARCQRVLKTCREECLDIFVSNPDRLPGTGTDYAGRQRRCIRECMENNGCYDF